MGITQFDERVAKVAAIEIDNAGGAGGFGVFAGGVYGSHLDTMFASQGDTIDHVLFIEYTLAGGSPVVVASVSLPAAIAGVRTQVDLLAVVFPLYAGGIAMPTGDTIGVRLAVAMVGASVCGVIASGGDF